MSTLVLIDVQQMKDLKINDIPNDLPRFIELAIGFENGGWYLQTTDKLEETYLSHPIIEGVASFEVVEKLAKNLASIFGLEIQYWTNIVK